MSKKALEVAQKNAKFHKVKINFLKSDLLSSPRLPKKFDLILANLPYLPSADIVPENSIYYEPRLALDGGRDGLDLIKKLIIELPKRLTENGLAILEIDPRQKTKIAELAQKSALKIEFQKDLNNRTRFALLSTSSVSPQT
jgi:release factor glutamine methyltransferase